MFLLPLQIKLLFWMAIQKSKSKVSLKLKITRKFFMLQLTQLEGTLPIALEIKFQCSIANQKGTKVLNKSKVQFQG